MPGGIISRNRFVENGPVEARMFDGAENGVADVGGRQSIPDFTACDALVDYIEQDTVELPDQGVGFTVKKRRHRYH